MIEVEKVWGKEVIIANEPEYCGKLLYVNKGASGSLHYHPKKKETFHLLKGRINLEYKSDVSFCFRMPGLCPVPLTIPAGTPHRFTAVLDSIILEISTHHDDEDVVRIEESRAGII